MRGRRLAVKVLLGISVRLKLMTLPQSLGVDLRAGGENDVLRPSLRQRERVVVVFDPGFGGRVQQETADAAANRLVFVAITLGGTWLRIVLPAACRRQGDRKSAV